MLIFDKVSVKAGNKEIVSDVSFSIRPHTLTVIIGKNGSGKSTVLSALISAVKYSGKISFCDADFALMKGTERAKLVSCLSQTLPYVNITVEELVKMGRAPYLDIGKRFTQTDLSAVEEAIKAVGITEYRNKYVSCLSGGEKQKAYLAMILAQGTRIAAFDEPTTYLDAEYQKEICNILKELKGKHKKTVLAVMHDITSALEIADNIVFLDNGRVIFTGTTEECIESGLIEKVYGMKKYYYEADGEKRILYR